MDEEKKGKRGVAHALTGVASPAWTAHRLQQLVESNIEPPLRLRFFRVALPSVDPQARAFVIDVPESTTAHQARDCLYYVRSEYEVKALRDYEIRLRMNRGTALSAQVEASMALRRPTKALQDEQLEDYLAEVAGLQDALTKNLPQDPERPASPPSSSVSTWSETEKRTLLQTLTQRARFDEVRLTMMLRNVGERTIRECDTNLDFHLPSDWLVFSRDDVQPRGGFFAVGEAHAAKLLQDQIIWADTNLSPSRRLLPQASAILRAYLLLIPEGARMAGALGTIRWTVHLDNSPRAAATSISFPSCDPSSTSKSRRVVKSDVPHRR